MKKRIYLTTPIYYINAKPHIGHAYTTILCDVARRFYRLIGYETYFLTGTDEHGDKILRAARANNCEPDEYADEISALFRNMWRALHIEHDDFIRTTEERHKKVVRDVLNRIYQKGEIYHARYGGFYCTGCERFYTEKELVEGKCPDHLVEPEWIEEENYFFKMSLYQEWLIQYINDHPDFIRPERYRNEALAFLKEPLKDLCVSRPRTRLPWGVPLPFDEQYVTYVWFDALVNYISAIGYPDGDKFKTFWSCSNHFIAKDILKPHAIYWPCMLKAAGIEPFQRLNVHGYWSLDKHKISKSLGNVVAPLDLSVQYGVDAFRYFLLKDMTFGLDADFSEENLIKRFNSDLANDFGNLVKRITEMIGKYCDSRIPEPAALLESDKIILSALEDLTNSMERLLEQLKFNDLLERIMNVARATNKYINDQAPWELYKKKDFPRLHTVLYVAGKLAASCAHLLSPVMPEKSNEALRQFGIEIKDDLSIDHLFLPGNSIQTGEILFPKVEKTLTPPDSAKSDAKNDKSMDEQLETVPRIEYDDFARVKLLTARVITAERVPKTDKLMSLEIDIGTEKRRIIAGIAGEYAPEDLEGKTIVVVENLKPRKMKGLESKGMLLAAHGKEGLSLITVDRPVEPGSSIS